MQVLQDKEAQLLDKVFSTVPAHETGELIDSSCFSLSAPFKRTDDGIPTPS